VTLIYVSYEVLTAVTMKIAISYELPRRVLPPSPELIFYLEDEIIRSSKMSVTI
jgi:hypothetical protein